MIVLNWLTLFYISFISSLQLKSDGYPKVKLKNISLNINWKCVKIKELEFERNLRNEIWKNGLYFTQTET